MKVSELAKELSVATADVLKKLKSLHLKAKDGNQELNHAVGIVVRSEVVKDIKSGAIRILSASELKEEELLLAKKRKKSKISKVASEDKSAKSKKAIKPKAVSKKAPAKKAGEKAAVTKGKKDKPAVDNKKTAPKVKERKPIKVVSPKTADKKVVKKKVVDAPFVSLKPLSRKKRKSTGKDDSASRTDNLARGADGSVGMQESDATQLATREAQEAFSAGELTPEQQAALKTLELKIPISVKDFAVSLQEKASTVLKKLMQLGVFANINQSLDEDVVRKLAYDFGFTITKLKTEEEQLIEDHKVQEEDPKLLEDRAPVVTFMGHVDHGKTSLLDQIRSSNIVDREHGGITQHIGAYSIKTKRGQITFLDTPGHEAFTSMRARGAHITDLVVLVIAADEGIMPQTKEAIDHARAAEVPIVVALNKIDRKNADVDMVKKQLAGVGLNPEDWGGNTIVAGVSAITGEGVDRLLEMILLESEMLELKANAQKMASGIVVEAHLSSGKGAVVSLIVQSGTLKLNDIIVVGSHWGKAKAMFDWRECPIQSAGPSVPVEILGLQGVPEAGENFYVVENEKIAKEISLKRQQHLTDEKHRSAKKITLEDLYSQVQQGSIKELNVILKADVQGSLEALKDSLSKIPSEEVKVKFIHSGVGEVNTSDVILANASNAIIIAFYVNVDTRAQEELEKSAIDLRQYRIIYDAVNDVKKALEGLLEPKMKRRFLARIEVRQVFKLSKSGIIAGCFVLKGKVNRKAKLDVVRNGEVVHSGNISSLKRFKDDVKEVNEGFECGVSIAGYDRIEAGDILEAFELETIVRTI